MAITVTMLYKQFNLLYKENIKYYDISVNFPSNSCVLISAFGRLCLLGAYSDELARLLFFLKKIYQNSCK